MKVSDPGGYGEEYHKVWKCDDYNIQIDSYARKFPDNTNREKITIDKVPNTN